MRFETIGTPEGERYAGIDRARFRMTFTGSDGQLKISQASLLTGTRLISDKPEFENVAQAAGVALMNRFYPKFLSEHQSFGMIRYGPAGMTAVDYDNEGSTIFRPDGGSWP